MKRKIVGILVCMLVMAAAVVPALGTMNEKIEKTTTNFHQPVVEWKKTFDRGEFDYFQTVRQTADGGYIASGTTEENNMFYVWLVKLDATGTEEWSVVNHDLNGSVMTPSALSVGGLDVHQTSDGGYILCGPSWILFDINGTPFWDYINYLWKTNATGSTQWLYHYYEQTQEYLTGPMAYNVIEVENGFVISGTMYYYYPGNQSYSAGNGYIMKTDSLGVMQWVREFDKGGTDSLPSVDQTSDGGYFLSGFTDAATTNNGALWMVKTDADGTKQWDTLFDGPGFDYTYGKGNFQTSDGGYIMDGVSDASGSGIDTRLIKADSNGNMVWNTTFGGTRSDYCWSMCAADTDGFALGIAKNFGYSGGTKDDILIVETTKDGNTEWQYEMVENGSQVTRFISPTSDGGYIVTAMTATMGNTLSDAVVLKIASFDNQQPAKPVADGPARGKVGKNSTFTASASDPDGDTLWYKWDWGDGNYSEWLSTAETTYSWAYKATFEVRVMTMDEHGYESDWSNPVPIKIPCSYNIPVMQFWMKLFERFPNAFPILRHLMGY